MLQRVVNNAIKHAQACIQGVGGQFEHLLYSRRVHLERVSKRVARDETRQVRLYTLVESSQFWHATQGDSQARHQIFCLVHHGSLKMRDINEAKHERRGYTRGSRVRRVFPSTFSHLPCLRFPRRECTTGIIFLTIHFHGCASFFPTEFLVVAFSFLGHFIWITMYMQPSVGVSAETLPSLCLFCPTMQQPHM